MSAYLLLFCHTFYPHLSVIKSYCLLVLVPIRGRRIQTSRVHMSLCVNVVKVLHVAMPLSAGALLHICTTLWVMMQLWHRADYVLGDSRLAPAATVLEYKVNSSVPSKLQLTNGKCRYWISKEDVIFCSMGGGGVVLRAFLVLLQQNSVHCSDHEQI